jgi:hypothetical protein
MQDTFRQFALVVAIKLLMVFSPVLSHGQHTAAFKVHTFRTIDGLYTIGYEQAFNRSVSAELSLQGGHYINVHPNRSEDYEVTGLGAIGAVRYYPFSNRLGAPRGFFGYAAFRYVDCTETFVSTTSGDRYRVGGNIINAGLGVGYKYTYRRIGLEAFVGWGVGRLKSDDDDYRNSIPEFHRASIEDQAHFPQLDLALCYMFSPSR